MKSSISELVEMVEADTGNASGMDFVSDFIPEEDINESLISRADASIRGELTEDYLPC